MDGHSSNTPGPLSDEVGVGHFGSEKLRGVRGDLLVCGRWLNFPGGFGFQRRKSPLLALESTNFQKI